MEQSPTEAASTPVENSGKQQEKGTDYTRIQHGLELQLKFKFYLLALTFTLLAGSVQTADLGKSLWSDVPELFAWTLLLISGLSGLKHLEISPNIYYLSQLDFENPDPVTRDAEDRAAKRSYRWYKVHRLTFVLGLVVIVAARVVASYVVCRSVLQ
jgi:hypothetical protein